jgi:hypothetical protein
LSRPRFPLPARRARATATSRARPTPATTTRARGAQAHAADAQAHATAEAAEAAAAARATAAAASRRAQALSTELDSIRSAAFDSRHVERELAEMRGRLAGEESARKRCVRDGRDSPARGAAAAPALEPARGASEARAHTRCRCAPLCATARPRRVRLPRSALACIAHSRARVRARRLEAELLVAQASRKAAADAARALRERVARDTAGTSVAPSRASGTWPPSPIGSPSPSLVDATAPYAAARASASAATPHDAAYGAPLPPQARGRPPMHSLALPTPTTPAWPPAEHKKTSPAAGENARLNAELAAALAASADAQAIRRSMHRRLHYLAATPAGSYAG